MLEKYAERFKEEIFRLAPYNQCVHELARVFRRHFLGYLKRIVRVPLREVEIYQFIRDTLQANEDLRNKRNPRQVGRPAQESESSEDIPEHILLDEEEEYASPSPKKKTRGMIGRQYKRKFRKLSF